MTRYLISFDEGAMDLLEEDMPDVAKAARRVQRALPLPLAPTSPHRPSSTGTG